LQDSPYEADIRGLLSTKVPVQCTPVTSLQHIQYITLPDIQYVTLPDVHL